MQINNIFLQSICYMIQHSEINSGSEPKTCPCVQKDMIELGAEE